MNKEYSFNTPFATNNNLISITNNKNLIPHPKNNPNTNYKNNKRINQKVINNINSKEYNINENKVTNNNIKSKDKVIEISIERELLKEKLEKNQNELLDIKNNIEKLNKRMYEIKNTLDNLRSKKNEKKNEIQNLLSNKETLEEMYNMEIIFIKNNEISSFNNNGINNCNINISNEEIKQININIFTSQIIELIKILFNSDSIDYLFNHALLNQIKNELDSFNNSSEFIDNISSIIVKYNETKYSKYLISSLLHYLIKINSINKIIEASKNFIKNEYKNKKQEINGELVEITFSLIFFENQKRKVLDLISRLNDKLIKLNKDQNNDNLLIIDNEIDNENSEKINANIFKDEKIDNEFNSSDENKIEKFKEEKKLMNENNNNNNINNNINGGNIEIRYNNNLNINIFNEKKEAKNMIYENYVNNGIVLNDKKKKFIKNNSLNFNSKYGNINKEDQNYKNQEKEKKLHGKKNNSKSFNYNFDSNFIDLKLTKNKATNTNNNRKKTIKIKNNNNSNNAQYNQINKTKKLEVRDKNQININNIKDYNKNLNNKYNILNINKQLKKNETQLRNSESLMGNSKKKNQRISNFQKYLDRFISNSSIDLNENYNSLNNLKDNSNDNIKSFRKKRKNITNIIINDSDDNNFNFYNNKNSRINRNTYIDARKYNQNKTLNYNLNIDNKHNIYDICKEKKRRKFSKSNVYEKKILKVNNNSCNAINNKTNYNIKNRPNEFNSGLKDLELDNQIKIFNQENFETFCFYKIIEKNINLYNYNSFKDSSINPEYFGYNQCYISIDIINGCLLISPKTSINKVKYQTKKNDYISIINNSEKTFFYNIKLKNIFSIYIDKYMKNVIKIQNILLKYNKENNNIINGNDNINKTNKILLIKKLMNTKEIKEIILEKKEIIKAALCNYFSFYFSLGNNNNSSKINIDLVFIDLANFNFWLNTLNSIAKNNVKSNKINIISFKKIKSKIKSIADKAKKYNQFNYNKNYNFNYWNENIKTKNIQSNKFL